MDKLWKKIDFRVTTEVHSAIHKIADARGTTVSSLYQDFTLHVINEEISRYEQITPSIEQLKEIIRNNESE